MGIRDLIKGDQEPISPVRLPAWIFQQVLEGAGRQGRGQQGYALMDRTVRQKGVDLAPMHGFGRRQVPAALQKPA